MHAPNRPTDRVEAVPTRGYLLGGALAAAFLFLLLARWVLAGDSMLFDLWIRDTVHGWASPLATRLLLAITMLGSEWVMLPLGAVLVWRLATTCHTRQATLLAAGSGGAELVSYLLKLAFHRPEPRFSSDSLPPGPTVSQAAMPSWARYSTDCWPASC